MNQIGKNIKKIRNVKGLSQQAFADVFRLTRGNISSYEEFRAEPKLEVLVRIANYFGIPLADFIEKDLSVNELLHYNSELVLETEKLKASRQLIRIPYVSLSYNNDFIENYLDEDFINKLPFIVLPGNSLSRLLAIESENLVTMPAGFDFHSGDILIYERVVKENAHKIPDKLGLMVNGEGLKSGIYEMVENRIHLSLNEWVNYPFDMNSDNHYYVLRATCIQSA